MKLGPNRQEDEVNEAVGAPGWRHGQGKSALGLSLPRGVVLTKGCAQLGEKLCHPPSTARRAPG